MRLELAYRVYINADLLWRTRQVKPKFFSQLIFRIFMLAMEQNLFSMRMRSVVNIHNPNMLI